MIDYKLLVIAHRRKPLCEQCGASQAEFMATTGGEYPQAANNKWEFLCGKCTPEDTDCYCFNIADLLRTDEEFTDWIKHLEGKRWFDELDFAWMLARFMTAGSARPRRLNGATPV